MTSLLALLAYLALTAAVLRSGCSLDWPSLALVLAALGLALAGSVAGRRESSGRLNPLLLPGMLGFLTAAELVWIALRPPIRPEERPSWPPALAALLIGLLSLTYIWKSFPWPRGRLLAILAVYFGLGGWLIRSAPPPAIDVWHFQQRASELLVQGVNPYAADYPNPYGDARFHGEKFLKDGRIQTFPYPPLSLLLVVPGYLAGDVRWSLLAAMVTATALLAATGWRLGLPPGHPAELAAVSFLCNPWGLLVVELAWTEPLLALASALAVWALAAGRRGVLTAALAGVLSLKQYGFLLLPAFGVSRRFGWPAVAMAAAAAVLIALPFFLWDPAAFGRGTVEYHLHNPLREDSLSVLAGVAVLTGLQLPGWIGFLAAATVAFWFWRRGAPSLSNVVLGSASILLAFFAFNRAAHLNYYWLVLMLLALAVITAAVEDREWEGQGSEAKSEQTRPA